MMHLETLTGIEDLTLAVTLNDRSFRILGWNSHFLTLSFVESVRKQ